MNFKLIVLTALFGIALAGVVKREVISSASSAPAVTAIIIPVNEATNATISPDTTTDADANATIPLAADQPQADEAQVVPEQQPLDNEINEEPELRLTTKATITQSTQAPTVVQSVVTTEVQTTPASQSMVAQVVETTTAPVVSTTASADEIQTTEVLTEAPVPTAA